jgi:hypothetical protein
MASIARNEILASKVLEYMRFRLSAEQTQSIDTRFDGFEDIDKMIEHIRGRLNSSFKQPVRDVFHHRFNPAQAKNSNVALMRIEN